MDGEEITFKKKVFIMNVECNQEVAKVSVGDLDSLATGTNISSLCWNCCRNSLWLIGLF